MLFGNPKVKAMTDAKRLTYQVTPGSLRITELFFSIEGEGTLIGCPTLLVRFASCNQRCQYCDTKFSSWWDDDAYEIKALDVLQTILDTPQAEWVSFTGGEPFYRAEGELDTFCQLAVDIVFGKAQRRLKIETSGTMLPPAHFPSEAVFWSIAPKIPGGGMGGGTFLDSDLLEELLTRFVKQGHVKFVIGVRAEQNSVAIDFAGIKNLAQHVPALTMGRLPVIFQPEGVGEDTDRYVEACRELVKGILADVELMTLFPSWRVLPRWHTLLWRNERRR